MLRNSKKIIKAPLKQLRRFRRRFHITRFDLRNKIRHGPEAPKIYERIWLDPMACDRILQARKGQEYSAQVLDGDWDLCTYRVEELAKIKFCIDHWERGMSWEAAGAYDHMLTHIKEVGPTMHGSTRADVVRRHDELDAIYNRIHNDNRLLSRQELKGTTFREFGGVYVHIDRELNPIFGGSGCHRFAISRILSLPIIPAMVGIVHVDALPVWRQKFRASQERAE